MKKIIVSLLAILMFQAMPSKAQISFGVKGGINVTNMKFSKDVIDAKNQSGFFIGPTVKFKLPLVGLGLDGAILYDQREADTDAFVGDNEESETAKIKQKSINVPINLRYTVGLGDLAGIYFAAGPQFGFNVGDKHLFDNSFKMKSSNLSVNVGAGVRLFNHLEIGANYNIACGKTGEFEFDGIEDIGENIGKLNMKSNSWQISAAYYF